MAFSDWGTKGKALPNKLKRISGLEKLTGDIQKVFAPDKEEEIWGGLIVGKTLRWGGGLIG